MNGPPPPNQEAPDSGTGILSESLVRVRAVPCATQPVPAVRPASLSRGTQPAGPTVSSPDVYQPAAKMLSGPTGIWAVTKAPQPSSENGLPGPVIAARWRERLPYTTAPSNW